jgi:translocation and assembly module TamB
VPDAEKLSWIVLGRPPDSGGADAALLMAAAGSVFGGEGAGPIAKIASALGVDEISFRPQTGADTPLAAQIVTVGKRLSTRTFLSYEQGLTAAAGTLKLSYALTRRLSLVSRAGADNALDIFYNFFLD